MKLVDRLRKTLERVYQKADVENDFATLKQIVPMLLTFEAKEEAARVEGADDLTTYMTSDEILSVQQVFDRARARRDAGEPRKGSSYARRLPHAYAEPKTLLVRRVIVSPEPREPDPPAPDPPEARWTLRIKPDGTLEEQER